jgi:hypothetical protein
MLEGSGHRARHRRLAQKNLVSGCQWLADRTD